LTAVGLVGCWCLAGLVYGLYGFAEKTVEMHALASPGPWHNPFPIGLGDAIFLGWMLTINALFAGWIVGLIAIIRGRQPHPIRCFAFTLGLLGAAVADFRIMSWSTQVIPRLPTTGLLHVAAGTAMFVLGLVPRTKPSVGRDRSGDPTVAM
jgi:hypothetical protein